MYGVLNDVDHDEDHCLVGCLGHTRTIVWLVALVTHVYVLYCPRDNLSEMLMRNVKTADLPVNMRESFSAQIHNYKHNSKHK